MSAPEVRVLCCFGCVKLCKGIFRYKNTQLEGHFIGFGGSNIESLELGMAPESLSATVLIIRELTFTLV